MVLFQSSVLFRAHPLSLRPLIFLEDCGKRKGSRKNNGTSYGNNRELISVCLRRGDLEDLTENFRSPTSKGEDFGQVILR